MGDSPLFGEGASMIHGTKLRRQLVDTSHPPRLPLLHMPLTSRISTLFQWQPAISIDSHLFHTRSPCYKSRYHIRLCARLCVTPSLYLAHQTSTRGRVSHRVFRIAPPPATSPYITDRHERGIYPFTVDEVSVTLITSSAQPTHYRILKILLSLVTRAFRQY